MLGLEGDLRTEVDGDDSMIQDGAGEGGGRVLQDPPRERERAEDNATVWTMHPERGKTACWGAGWMGVTHCCGLSVCLEAYATNLILRV